MEPCAPVSHAGTSVDSMTEIFQLSHIQAVATAQLTECCKCNLNARASTNIY